MTDTLQAESRVTWFADEDYWGTVTAVDGDEVTVRWDDSPQPTVYERQHIRLRHNMGVKAATAEQSAADSFDRSDTDGFVSQWASQTKAREYRLQAELAEAGNMHEFPALFDTEGNLVPAKWIETRFGFAWGLLPSDDPRGRFTGFFNPSQARDPQRRKANDARKGYQVGLVRAPAAAKLQGSGTGLAGALTVHPVIFRTDGGFSRHVEIVTAADYEGEL